MAVGAAVVITIVVVGIAFAAYFYYTVYYNPTPGISGGVTNPNMT